MTNSSTQMSPVTPPVDAQAINESLDLIRDILRDSGTRLLNLITNMSLSTLASVERVGARRGAGGAERGGGGGGSRRHAARAHSDDSEGAARPRASPRVRLFSSSLRRDLLSSSSDSDSDQSLEVNIFRTRNSSFREDSTRNPGRSTNNATADGVAPPTDRMTFELNEDSRNETPARENGGINVSSSNSRFRVRTQGSASTDADATSARERGAADGESRGGSADSNLNRPSTSRDNFWTRGCVVPPDEAYRKVRSGVNALQKHTILLTNLWLRGNRTTMRELRNMWENLRRRILMLHRETGRQDLPSYYTRSLLERCMFLSEMSNNISRSSSRTARPQGPRQDERNLFERRDAPANSDNSNSNVTESERNTSTESNIGNRRARRSPQTRPMPSIRASPAIRRRLQPSYRWRPEDELRRRSRNPAANRLAHRYPHNRSRRDLARAIEISATRQEIRMRAMQVLSVMFNMMMMCLEERGLSQLIINMLRTLKKALALTCLMLMTNRNNSRSGSNAGHSSQRVDSLNVVRIQNVEHSGPVNVDGPDEVMSPNNPTPVVEPEPETTSTQRANDEVQKAPEVEEPRSSTSMTADESRLQEDASATLSAAQRWSNRLAVQIASANRNNSVTARNRRDLYLESRRLKALHRTNPGAHPMIKKRVPPISHHRIPALRFLPSRGPGINAPKNRPAEEPVAGPSSAPPDTSPGQDLPRSDVINDFEQRVHLIRLAQMQAVRLRTAARNRFRRLQTIRLYTPSSVREMFALQSNNTENQPGNRSPLQNGPELGNRRPFATYRPHILTPRNEPAGEDAGHYHPVLNNVSGPLTPPHSLAASAEPPAANPQRLPRIHEYLQPIILAQVIVVCNKRRSGLILNA